MVFFCSCTISLFFRVLRYCAFIWLPAVMQSKSAIARKDAECPPHIMGERANSLQICCSHLKLKYMFGGHVFLFYFGSMILAENTMHPMTWSCLSGNFLANLVLANIPYCAGFTRRMFISPIGIFCISIWQRNLAYTVGSFIQLRQKL